GAADGDGFVVTVAMTSLVGCAGEDFASILRSLNYAPEQREGPAITVPLVPRAATAPAEAAPGESGQGESSKDEAGTDQAGTDAGAALAGPVDAGTAPEETASLAAEAPAVTEAAAEATETPTPEA